MKKIHSLTLLVLLCFFAANSFAQRPTDIQKELVVAFRQIVTAGSYRTLEGFDSLTAANRNFKKLLLRYTSSNSKTLAFQFDDLESAGVSIATSPDGMFRIYSWDTEMGGTMREFDNVCQYASGGKVYGVSIVDRRADGDPGYWYSAVNQLKVGERTLYLVVRHGIFSTKDSYQGIKIFGLRKNSLTSGVAIIKTESGLYSELGVYYDFFSVVDRKERPIILAEYNPELKQITLPVVSDDGTVTSRVIVYKYDGKHFVKVK
jgi:hypothetical protein